MAKAVKKILSRESVKERDGIEKHRQDTQDNLKREIDTNKVATAPDGAFDVTSEEQQRGRVLPRYLFVKKVQKLNRGIIYEQSINYPEQGGFYVNDTILGKVFVCGFPHDSVTEFDVRHTVPSVIPSPDLAPYWVEIQKVDQRVRGWRSVLLTLMGYGLVTKAQVEKEFKITEGRSSRYWQAAVN